MGKKSAETEFAFRLARVQVKVYLVVVAVNHPRPTLVIHDHHQVMKSHARAEFHDCARLSTLSTLSQRVIVIICFFQNTDFLTRGK